MTDYTQATNHAVHPSEILGDILNDRGITQKQLASRLGISEKHMSELLNGDVSLTINMAMRLEFVLDTPAETWLKLQANYDMIMSRLSIKDQMNEQFETEKNILTDFRYCYNNLQRWDLVAKTLKPKERYKNILNYFGVPSLQLLLNNYHPVKYRNSTDEPDQYCVAAWLRFGEKQYESEAVKTNFDASKFSVSLKDIRQLTKEPIHASSKKLVNICAENGVSLVFTPYFSKSYINGATRWVAPSKPLIQLSEKNKRSDALWFTFFHEAAHLILHSRKQSYINWDKPSLTSGEEELEADRYARDVLIPKEKYNLFISKGDYSNASIREFSNALGIGADILAGRLAHERIIDWTIASKHQKKIMLEKSG
ncbi:MAG: HigA family addiction module antitoxin [Candidatus Korobacteraceae bacterium]|jgi:HTH-type transcriptional regulator/antitoxin HigA